MRGGTPRCCGAKRPKPPSTTTCTPPRLSLQPGRGAAKKNTTWGVKESQGVGIKPPGGLGPVVRSGWSPYNRPIAPFLLLPNPSRRPVTLIFRTLALIAIALLGANLILGLAIGDYNGQFAEILRFAKQSKEAERQSDGEDQAGQGRALAELSEAHDAFQPIKRRAGFHILLGMISALTTVLVSSVSVTYFVGTSRWCKEVVEAYGLDPELAERSNQLKRRSFPLSVVSMVTMMLLVATGGLVASPDTFREIAASVVPAHQILAFTATAFVAFAFVQQMRLVGANYAVIQAITDQAQAMKAKTGDPFEAPFTVE